MKNVRLDLIVAGIKKALDLDNNVHIAVTDILNKDNAVIGTKITLDFPVGKIGEYLKKWNSWKNAHKYRKI